MIDFFKVLTKTTDPKLISTDVFDRQSAVNEITAKVHLNKSSRL